MLRTLDSDLDDTGPRARPITTRHLLTSTSGHGFATFESVVVPLLMEQLGQASMDMSGIPAPDEWMRRLAGIPLMHQPGDGWTKQRLLRRARRPARTRVRDVVRRPDGRTSAGAARHGRHRLPRAGRQAAASPRSTPTTSTGPECHRRAGRAVRCCASVRLGLRRSRHDGRRPARVRPDAARRGGGAKQPPPPRRVGSPDDDRPDHPAAPGDWAGSSSTARAGASAAASTPRCSARGTCPVATAGSAARAPWLTSIRATVS